MEQAVTSDTRSQQESILCVTEDKALQPAFDLAPPHPSRWQVVSLSLSSCVAGKAYTD
jgi:hypothetical protein